MSLDKTYAVGAFGSAIRVENHDSNTLVDISLNSLIGSSNPLSTSPKDAFISQGMVNNYHLVDVMTDPDDPNNWVAIEPSPNSTDNGFTGNPDADKDADGMTAFLEHAVGTSENEFNTQSSIFSVSLN